MIGGLGNVCRPDEYHSRNFNGTHGSILGKLKIGRDDKGSVSNTEHPEVRLASESSRMSMARVVQASPGPIRTNGSIWLFSNHSGFAPENLITLRHFSVSSATS